MPVFDNLKGTTSIDFRIGKAAAGSRTLYFCAVSSLPGIRYNDGLTRCEISHDGSTWIGMTVTAAINSIPTTTGSSTSLAIGWIPTSSSTPSAVATTGSAGSGTTVSFANHVHAAQLTPSGEPIGFENRTDSALSFDNASRTLTIQPKAPATSFSYWIGTNAKYTKSAAETKQITTDVGMHYLYYNGATLTDSLVFPGFGSALVSFVYWDGAKILGLADERHGVGMDLSTHAYLHMTVGARYQSGFALARIATGTGAADGDAQVRLDGGTIWDEDISCVISRAASPTAPFEQELGSGSTPGKIPIYYRTGATGPWTKDTATNYPVRSFDGSAGAPIGYNLNNSGTWSVASVGNGSYCAVWIVATNQQDEPVIAIMGQRTDSSLNTAQANNTWAAMSFGTLFYPEMKLLYRMIFRTNTAYANAIKAYVAETVDYRSVQSLAVGNYTATDHNSLSGRTSVNSHPATAVETSVTNFNGILTATETDVQLALDAVVASIKRGTGSPEGVVTAAIGSIYLRTDGGVGTALYQKTTGTGNTGWTATAGGGGGISADDHKVLRQLTHFIDNGPAEGFTSGAYREMTGTAFPTAIIWYDNNGGSKKKIVEKLITWTGVLPSPIVWKVYDAAESLLVTITDTVTYSGIFETSRLRAIT